MHASNVRNTKCKKLRNLPIMKDEWSYLECIDVEVEICDKLECSGVELVRNVEKCWNMSSH